MGKFSPHHNCNQDKMGVRHLNSFIRNNCQRATKCVSFSELSGKKIAVDISIYLYKYLETDTLIENMYLMMSIFRYYGVIPIFVFDGKPPPEKKELLKERRLLKESAEEEYNKLKKMSQCEELEKEEKNEILTAMYSLKKKFIYITKEHTSIIKKLIVSYGLTYHDAVGEADELCALLTIKKRVWACMSEDMDMFIYGCPRVLRYFSLLKKTAILYDYRIILEELGLIEKEFREICVLSGTDYNICSGQQHTLSKTLKLFKKYHKTGEEDDFYEWVLKNKPCYINDIELLKTVNSMFDITNDEKNYKIHDVQIMNARINKDEMKSILREDGFVFSF